MKQLQIHPLDSNSFIFMHLNLELEPPLANSESATVNVTKIASKDILSSS